MPEQTFLPYRFADSALDLEIAGLAVDGQVVDLDEQLDPRRRAIVLSDRGGWRELTLQLVVSDPNGELQELVQDGEDPEEVLRVMVLARGRKGRLRGGIDLAIGHGAWAGDLTLRRADHHGSVSLQAVAVRRIEKHGDPERASHFGERVAWAEGWTLYLDDRVVVPGGAIDGEWKDFGATDSAEALRQRSGCLWHLDLGDREKPRLFLNEGIEGFRRALEVPQKIGRAARVRDALAHSVLQPVLASLAVTAIASADSSEFEDLSGWRQDLLRTLGEQSEKSTEETIVESWLDSWRAGDQAGVLAELSAAVQGHLQVGKAATYLVQALEERNRG